MSYGSCLSFVLFEFGFYPAQTDASKIFCNFLFWISAIDCNICLHIHSAAHCLLIMSSNSKPAYKFCKYYAVNASSKICISAFGIFAFLWTLHKVWAARQRQQFLSKFEKLTVKIAKQFAIRCGVVLTNNIMP